MKMCVILLIVAFGLLLLPAAAFFGPGISSNQSVNFSANGLFYWAMIYDYTDNVRETDTGGLINVNSSLEYDCWLDVQVAYIYSASQSRYVEALALRDIAIP